MSGSHQGHDGGNEMTENKIGINPDDSGPRPKNPPKGQAAHIQPSPQPVTAELLGRLAMAAYKESVAAFTVEDFDRNWGQALLDKLVVEFGIRQTHVGVNQLALLCVDEHGTYIPIKLPEATR